MAYIAGAFTATWNSSNIGKTRAGFELIENHLNQPIQTDDGGDTVVDAVQQGTEVLVRLDYVEYDLIRNALYAANTQGQPKANVGKVLSSLAKPLVLTPIAGTPAASEATPIRTFHLAIIESDIQTLLSSKLRQGPVTFRCYPDPANSNKAYTRS